MKIIILILALGTFVIGLTEFITSGILIFIAKDFKIDVSTCGLATSLYATSVLIFAPILTTISAKINRKNLLFLIMLNFILGNFVTLFAPNCTILIIGRIICGMSHGLFMSIGTLIAIDIVKKDKQALAISLMFSGLTIATILGVPLGTLLANMFSWRIIFVIILILSLLVLFGFTLIPNNLKKSQVINWNDHLKLLKNKTSISTLFLTIFGYGATFVIYTFITPMIVFFTKINETYVSLILLIIGIFVAIGNIIGGKITNKNTLKNLSIIFILQIISYLLFYTLKFNSNLLYIVSGFFGLMVFMNVSGLQLITINGSKKYNPDVINLISSYNISSFNLGITLGGFIGQITLSYLNYIYLPLFACIVLVFALLISLTNKNLKTL